MRLNKFISETGICSRREADRFIEQGRVKVNGRRADLGTQVEEGDDVRLNGKRIGQREKPHVYIALNKPVGIVCTTDRSERDNITDHVNHPARIFPIGRLDKESEGLILLTSDGDIVNELLRVENRHEKEYVVTVDRPVTDKLIGSLARGVHLPELGETTKRCVVTRINANMLRIVLTQGLNRQIRRMLDVFGYGVRRLQRVRFVNIQLGNLKPGQWRDLQPHELRGLLPQRGDAESAPEPQVAERREPKAPPPELNPWLRR